MPHARFLELLCPWPGCGFQIWFIDFRLELVNQTLYEQGVKSWEDGPGLIGGCPGCGQGVLFTQTGKARVETAVDPPGAVRLPANWFEIALLLDQDGNVITF